MKRSALATILLSGSLAAQAGGPSLDAQAQVLPAIADLTFAVEGAEPGALALLAAAPSSETALTTPFGTLFLDPSALIQVVSFPIGASGAGSHTLGLPAPMTAGGLPALELQALQLPVGGSPSLTVNPVTVDFEIDGVFVITPNGCQYCYYDEVEQVCICEDC